ncbi:DUF3509 domain-containing protein [Pseudomonas sp. 148P]|uniref:DUF3509 domain-containing protein n=1 Tax=Pseudomonas ulcerans TaxID=3115852 RepID=A0ABU7HV54_9PSED|nr:MULTISPECIES: DUF3509 domain-containing protein [unclassified Pseudomonas]MEE1923512.1 DUF3509 domain-containing protein [Pseudomonas sp. 147P]MEE1935421.1 DUF3509 domain-containing protein [Pseudomonas sp. 148P]
MHNPFQQISAAFSAQYRVNLSIERLDGSIMLTLSDDDGAIIAKRLISPAQRNDPKRLERLIDSVRFGIAIEQGHSAMEVLAAMTEQGKRASRWGSSAHH